MHDISLGLRLPPLALRPDDGTNDEYYVMSNVQT